MQNEFEKQVREKMEELDLVPSAPVWDKIEMQIQKKKDRRRLVLWIPLAFLLLSGGVWWMIADRQVPDNDVSMNKPGNSSEANPGSIEGNTSGSIQVEEETDSQPSGIISGRQEIAKQDEIHSIVKNQLSPQSIQHITKQPGINNRVSQKNHFAENNNNNHSAATESREVKESIIENNSEAHIEAKNISDQEESRLQIYPVIPGTSSPDKSTDSVLMKDSVAEVLPAVVKMAEKIKQPGRKLQWGISFGGGIAGEGSGIRLKSINNLDVSTSVPPLTNVSEEASATNRNVHFGTGIKIRKQLGERFAVVSGIGYDYYSSKREMGTFVSTPTATSGGITYNEFFLNFGQELNEIKSKYHFISLPLLLEWKVNKKIPVLVQGGLSIQQLIASDAWQFDKQLKVYFKDHNRLEKTQVFANLNLGYQFNVAAHPLIVGPSIQYGLNNLNLSEGKRLFSLGLNAQFYLR